MQPFTAMAVAYLILGLIRGLQAGVAGLPCLYRVCEGEPGALATGAYWATVLGYQIPLWPRYL